MRERKLEIDILRCLGILLVISAHCAFKNALFFEIRTFDVVLLVFVSILSFQESSRSNYCNYVKKRFVKLILPIWLFLTAYFILFYIIGIKYSLYEIATSYLMLSGIGYIWIYRVMFINSLVTPIVNKYIKVNSGLMLFVVIIVFLLLTDVSYYLTETIINNSLAQNVIEVLVTYTIGYCSITVLGINWNCLEKKDKLISVSLFMIMFISLFILKNTNSIQEFKYPPQSLYLIYGMIASIILYELVKLIKISNDRIINFITWFSKNSSRIYLTHVVILNISVKYFTWLNDIYGLRKFFVVVLFAFVGCALFNVLWKKISNQYMKGVGNND